MKKKISISITTILLITIIFAGSTFAYFSTLVKGQGNDVLLDSSGFGIIYNGGEHIGGQMQLSADKSGGFSTTVDIGLTNNVNINVEADILLNIDTISDNLKINGFKWESYRLDGNNEIKVQEGNFSNASNRDVIQVVSHYVLPTNPVRQTYFKIYLWIDGNDPSVGNSVGDGTASFSGFISAKTEKVTGILDRYTVTFDANGGTTPISSKQVTYGETYGELPTPSREGYTFKGWNGKNIISDDKIRDYSNWKRDIVTNGSYPTNNGNPGFLLDLDVGKTYTISITLASTSQSEIPPYLYLCKAVDDNGYLVTYLTTTNIVNLNYTFSVEDGEVYFLRMGGSGNQSQFNTNIARLITIQLEENPFATAYEPYYVTSATTVVQDKDQTLKAIWEPNKYSVTFDANGGEVDIPSKTVTYGGTYGDLPIPTRDGYTFLGWSLLPSTYLPVEYIQSTGTQYINTNIELFNSINHEMIFDFEPTSFYNYNTIWGSTFDSDTFEGWIYNNGKLASRFRNVRYGTDNAILTGTRYVYDLKKDGTNLYKFVNGTSFGSGTLTASLTDVQKSSKLLLFLSGSDYGKYKLYNVKLYRDDELVSDLHPCLNTSSNYYGLYDKIRDVFLANSATTGDDFEHGTINYVTSSTEVTQNNVHTLTAIWEVNS